MFMQTRIRWEAVAASIAHVSFDPSVNDCVRFHAGIVHETLLAIRALVRALAGMPVSDMRSQTDLVR